MTFAGGNSGHQRQNFETFWGFQDKGKEKVLCSLPGLPFKTFKKTKTKKKTITLRTQNVPKSTSGCFSPSWNSDLNNYK